LPFGHACRTSVKILLIEHPNLPALDPTILSAKGWIKWTSPRF
jgi:hypothetical protein